MPRLFLLLICIFSLTGCGTTPVRSKAEMRARVYAVPTTVQGNYLRLARHWDEHASKLSIDLVGASFLTVIEDERRAEITIGQGPYYGMIELKEIEPGLTLVSCFAWGGLTSQIDEWRRFILESASLPRLRTTSLATHPKGVRHLPSLPNQALQPTATAVMHPADAGCPPAAAVADL